MKSFEQSEFNASRSGAIAGTVPASGRGLMIAFMFLPYVYSPCSMSVQNSSMGRVLMLTDPMASIATIFIVSP